MANFNEFEVGALRLRPKVIAARTQFHIVRRLAPLLSSLTSLESLKKLPNEETGILKAAGLMGEALAKLDDATVDYVLDHVLTAAEVQQTAGLGWAPLRVNGVPMYPLDLMGEMTVAFHVLRANLAGFLSALPAAGGALKAQPQPAGG